MERLTNSTQNWEPSVDQSIVWHGAVNQVGLCARACLLSRPGLPTWVVSGWGYQLIDEQPEK
jgi:hypothetical protein